MVWDCPSHPSTLGCAQPTCGGGPRQGSRTAGATPANSRSRTPSRAVSASVTGREIAAGLDGVADQGTCTSGPATLQEQFTPVQAGDSAEMASGVGEAQVDLSTRPEQGRTASAERRTRDADFAFGTRESWSGLREAPWRSRETGP